MKDEPPTDATRSSPPALVPPGAAERAPVRLDAGASLEDAPERYVVEGELGAGGMGVVLVARGERLGRSVALKLVSADREDLRRRFEREGRVTARLQHPAIVPVYGMGRSRDGRPFYAMKHVTGEPLDKVLARTTTRADRLALLPKVIAVTEAIAFAHAERVIHRDLKPANILVGAFGETVVIDWGLAKELDTTDDAAVTDDPYRGGDADRTQHGKVMGTPAYMPLEQARGEVLDERADVYALGAILYHVLAGLPPHAREGEHGVPWESMLARVITSEPEALAKRQPDLPPDLIAIVDRAMAREPANRYGSAGELAEDLRRFQTGQLVGAHRYSTWQLVRRWVHRHRAAVLVGAASLAVLAVVAVVSITRIVRARERAETERAIAEQQRGLAQQREIETEQLMGYMLFDLRDKLEIAGKVDLLGEVAQRAAKHYANRPDTDQPEELERRSKIRGNIGDVLASQGRLPEALVEHRAAIAGWQRLFARDESNVRWRRQLAATYSKVGDVLDRQGDRKGAMTQVETARNLLLEGVRRTPDDRELLVDLSAAYTRVQDVLIASGDVAGGLAQLELARAIDEKLLALDPENATFRSNLATTQYQIGEVLRAQGDLTKALVAFRKSVELSSAVVSKDPKNARAQTQLSGGLDVVGRILSYQGDATGALESYRASLAIRERVAALDPSNLEAQRNVAISHNAIGFLLGRMGDTKGSLAAFRTEIAQREKLFAQSPSDATLGADVFSARSALGSTMIDLGDTKGALAELEAARQLGERIVALDPSSGRAQLSLMAVHLNTGDAIRYGGNPPGALASYERALAIAEAMAKKDATNTRVTSALSILHNNLTEVRLARGETAKAIEHARASVAIAEGLVAKDANNAQAASGLAVSREKLADALMAANQVDAALAEYRASETIIARISAQDPASVIYQMQAVTSQLRIGDALSKKGDRPGARAAWRKGIEIGEAALKSAPAHAELANAVRQLKSRAP